MTITTAAIGKLTLSELNVRKTDRAAEIEALADDIGARGLKQNLVVVQNGKAGHYEVVAGGRRFQALQLLVQRKAMRTTDLVPILIEDRDQGVETSLAENLHRLAMNPADELEAFNAVIAAAKGSEAERIAYCAKRFGTTVRHVEQRLRLASLATPIMDALRSGAITLDVAKAFAATADPDRQLAAFEALSKQAKSWGRPIEAAAARRVLTEGSVTNADPRAVLVGRTAYEAAGGRVEADLFAAVGTERWIDVPLLEELATAHMAAAAVALKDAEGFGDVIPVVGMGVPYEIAGKLDSWYPKLAENVDDETAAKIEGLEAEQEALNERLNAAEDGPEDDEGCPLDPELAKAWHRYADINEEIEAARIAGKDAGVPPEKRARFRRFLTLGADGKPQLAEGWYSDVKVDRQGDPVEKIRPAGTAAAVAGGMSESLAGELAMQRRDILAVHLAQDPALALLYAQFTVLDRVVNVMKGAVASVQSSALQINEQDRWEPIPRGQIEGDGTAYAHIREAQGCRSMAWLRDELDWSWCEGLEKPERYYGHTVDKQQLGRFDRFAALPPESRAALFAWAVATSLKPSAATSRQAEVHDRLGELLEIDVAKWWRPTGPNYFARIGVDDIKAALAEMSGGTAEGKGKKGELVAQAAALAEGASAHSHHVNALGRQWVPEAMRFRRLPNAAALAPESAS